MKLRLPIRAIIVATLLVLCAPILLAQQPERRVAVTFDDLVWAGPGDMASDASQQHAALIAALGLADVRGVAFVNERELEIDGVVDEARLAMLRDWLDAGWELGNHTWGHVDLHAVGLAAYSADILRGERVLKPLLATRGKVPRWFRHPYLRAGRSAPPGSRSSSQLSSGRSSSANASGGRPGVVSGRRDKSALRAGSCCGPP